VGIILSDKGSLTRRRDFVAILGWAGLGLPFGSGGEQIASSGAEPMARTHQRAGASPHTPHAPSRSFRPPGKQIEVGPKMSISAIQSAINGAGADNAVVFAPGEYHGNFTVADGVYLYSLKPNAAVLYGSFDGRGRSRWTVDGFQIIDGGFAVAKSSEATIGRCDFLYGPATGETVVPTGDTTNLSIINVSFRHIHQPSYVPGGNGLGNGYAISGWNDSGLYVGGCVFDDLREGICLDHSDSMETGNNIIFEQNYFNRLTRMCIEVDAQDTPGHVGHLICRNNYAENSIPKEDPGLKVLSGAVAWSIVPALGDESEVSGNFADGRWAGGLSAIAVELFGSGRVFHNVCVGYRIGCETYNGNNRDADQQVFENNFNGSAPGIAPDAWITGCLEGNPRFSAWHNGPAPFTTPERPSPIAWHD
jgi:hypothetical protein